MPQKYFIAEPSPHGDILWLGNPPSPDVEIENGRVYRIEIDKPQFPHNIHHYLGKSPPEYMRWLIHRYSNPSNHVLDPFCGSGTTGVEAIKSERCFTGIDINPLARFITKVKTTSIGYRALKDSTERALRWTDIYDPVRENATPWLESEKRGIGKFFSDESIQQIYDVITMIIALSEDIPSQNFLLLCLSSVLRAASTKNDPRYPIPKHQKNKSVIELFAQAVAEKTPQMSKYQTEKGIGYRVLDLMGHQTVHDSLSQLDYKTVPIDFVLTSPPYIDTVDYVSMWQIENYVINTLVFRNKQDDNKLQKLQPGFKRDFYKMKHREPPPPLGHETADTLIAALMALDTEPSEYAGTEKAWMLYEYLAFMKKHLADIHDRIAPGVHYALILANHQIHGHTFEPTKCLAHFATQIGYEVEAHFGLQNHRHQPHIPRDNRIDVEWILVLRKGDKR